MNYERELTAAEEYLDTGQLEIDKLSNNIAVELLKEILEKTKKGEWNRVDERIERLDRFIRPDLDFENEKFRLVMRVLECIRRH